MGGSNTGGNTTQISLPSSVASSRSASQQHSPLQPVSSLASGPAGVPPHSSWQPGPIPSLPYPQHYLGPPNPSFPYVQPVIQHPHLTNLPLFYYPNVVAPPPHLQHVSSRSASPLRGPRAHHPLPPQPQPPSSAAYQGRGNGRYQQLAPNYQYQPQVTKANGLARAGRPSNEAFVFTRPALDHRIPSQSVPATPTPKIRTMAGVNGTATAAAVKSRSPSPRRSPRSDASGSQDPPQPSSVSNASSATKGCRFETALAGSRRRIPYTVGPDKLERAKGVVRTRLRPHEEEKLTRSMEMLYTDLLPSAESSERRAKFLSKLERMLNEEWPGNDIKVHVFGSSGNSLCTSDSDVDVCITTSYKALEKVCLLANALSKRGMERVVCISHAKVPIVKLWDPEFQMACDLNVNNTLALENTRMIRTYIEIDPRVRPLAMIIKHWTKKRVINDAALGGTLSSYTWICLILNFLQTRKPPILPSLHERKRTYPQEAKGVNGNPSEFADDLKRLKGFGSSNKETLGELLFTFFRRHAHEIDYDTYVASIRLGKAISKKEKGWHQVQDNRLGVEEPFNTNRNLGNTADDTSFRGIHMELRRAFTLVAEECDLSKCCEQFVFPAEDPKIFQRPLPGPKPVLSRSISQAGRQNLVNGKGPVNRGRHSTMNGHINGVNNGGRRASSHVSSGSMANIVPSPADYYMQTQHAQKALQENLAWHMYQLRAAEKELRYIHQINNQVLGNATGSPPPPLPPMLASQVPVPQIPVAQVPPSQIPTSQIPPVSMPISQAPLPIPVMASSPAVATARPSKEYVGYIIDSRMQRRDSAPPPPAIPMPTPPKTRFAVVPIPPFKAREQNQATVSSSASTIGPFEANKSSTGTKKAALPTRESIAKPLIVNGASSKPHDSSGMEVYINGSGPKVNGTSEKHKENRTIEPVEPQQRDKVPAKANGISYPLDTKKKPVAQEFKVVHASPQAREANCVQLLRSVLDTKTKTTITSDYRQLREIFNYLEVFPRKQTEVMSQVGIGAEKMDELRARLDGLERTRSSLGG